MPITSGGYLLDPPEKHWSCPNCDQQCVSRGVGIHQTPMHTCPGLKMLSAPLVEDGVECKVEAKVREDYVGREDVTYDEDGKPIMAVETTREEGNDVAVFAPCVNAKMEI